MIHACHSLCFSLRFAQPHPANVSDNKWALASPYAPARRNDPQQVYPLRAVFNAPDHAGRNPLALVVGQLSPSPIVAQPASSLARQRLSRYAR